MERYRSKILGTYKETSVKDLIFVLFSIVIPSVIGFSIGSSVDHLSLGLLIVIGAIGAFSGLVEKYISDKLESK